MIVRPSHYNQNNHQLLNIPDKTFSVIRSIEKYSGMVGFFSWYHRWLIEIDDNYADALMLDIPNYAGFDTTSVDDKVWYTEEINVYQLNGWI